MPRPATLILAVITTALAGCSSLQATAGSARRAAVDYNRAFADARNEILLLNILRAEAHEPLQFSTVSSVTGEMHPRATFSTAFENIIFGGAEAINPSIELGALNPAVTIVPLDSKEFRQGMARPVSLELINHLLGQGFSRRAVLDLAIGGVVCPSSDGGQRVVINSGRDPEVVAKFAEIAARSEGWDVGEQTGAKFATVLLPASDGLELLRNGAGPGRSVAAIRQSPEDKRKGLVEVDIVEGSEPSIRNLDLSSVCGVEASVIKPASRLVLRSPEAMISYLGEVSGVAQARQCDQRSTPAENMMVFRIRAVCGRSKGPSSAVVQTNYRGRTYYIASSDLLHAADGERAEDLTLRVLAVLSQLIALQTTEASLAASRPVIVIPQ